MTVVRVNEGSLRGQECENGSEKNQKYYSFRGIPYGKPPVKELRFKAPRPAEPWEGVRDATEESKQSFSRDMLTRQRGGEEDCLYLNVYTTQLPHQTNQLKPVMVFIHGGGFITGSNSKLIYNPEYLLREDVVLVAINYRLGLLGFLSLDDPKYEIPGNAGFKDMVLALKWIKNNIKNFNGNPENITIFGESAGAASVHYLILSPLAKGLFHKAISQSGTSLCPWAQSANSTSKLAEMLNVTIENLYEKLQDLTPDEILTLQEKLPESYDASVMRHAGATIEKPGEGAFLTRSPLEILESGEYNHVPFLLGYNDREGMLADSFGPFNVDGYVADPEMRVPFALGIKKGSSESKELSQKIKKFYHGDNEPNRDEVDVLYKELSDNFFIRDIYRSAFMQSKTSSAPVYFYKMTIETRINLFKSISKIKSPGVNHADDLSYLFNTPINGHITPGSIEDVAIRRFCRLWTNFAKFGCPNGAPGDPLIPIVWKPFVPHEQNFLDIGEALKTKVGPNKKRMAFWMDIYDKYMSPVSKL